ncbi:MAG: hypothetical protein WC586_05985 [Methanoregula sp.]
MSDTFRATGSLFRHHPDSTRRRLNKAFRLTEKEYFRRFGEFLKKCRSGGFALREKVFAPGK